MAIETARAAMSVTTTVRIVPRVAPLRPAMWVVLVERKEVNALAVFLSLSKKAIS
jgi:hypothetical protein